MLPPVPLYQSNIQFARLFVQLFSVRSAVQPFVQLFSRSFSQISFSLPFSQISWTSQANKFVTESGCPEYQDFLIRHRESSSTFVGFQILIFEAGGFGNPPERRKLRNLNCECHRLRSCCIINYNSCRLARRSIISFNGNSNFAITGNCACN